MSDSDRYATLDTRHDLCDVSPCHECKINTCTDSEGNEYHGRIIGDYCIDCGLLIS